jgi:hypothetical protein
MDTEWSLNPDIFKEICTMFGKPNIDLFASRLNNKLPKCVSFLPKPSACAIDVVNMKFYSNKLCFSFPPFSCIGRLDIK